MNPHVENGSLVPLWPAATTTAVNVNSSLSSTVEITLNAATERIAIYATGADVYLAWGTDAASSSNFDEVIPKGQVRHIWKIPYDTSARFTAFNVIEVAASATIYIMEY